MPLAPRFIMIGGFLGAGKTTAIARLANHYRSLGKRVVIVTNDQAADLVDTLLLRSHGFDVGEVAGSCFCCDFNGLTQAVESLGESGRPDVILAEPVGSCTDLVATVIRPLEQIYQQPLQIAPYGVIIKPSHGFKILGEGAGGFSPKAEYIFRKQLEEADFVVLNRIDELAPERVAEIEGMLEREFPGIPVLRTSALTGYGFDELARRLENSVSSARRQMDVDYDTYAEGEAELGWLNGQAECDANQEVSLDEFLIGLITILQGQLLAHQAEVAHLKAIVMADGMQGVANLISSQSKPVLSLPAGGQAKRFDVVVNARVGIAPERLEAIVRDALMLVGEEFAIDCRIKTLQSFRPGRPVPTHRLVNDAASE